jgi:hypothetical protein
LSNPFLAVCSLFVWLMADGWWLVLIYPERKVLVAGLFWEKSTDGWCLISQTNRLVDYVIHSYYRTCLLWLTSHGSSAGSRSRSRTKDPRAPCSCWPRREKRSRFQFSERIGKVKKLRSAYSSGQTIPLGPVWLLLVQTEQCLLASSAPPVFLKRAPPLSSSSTGVGGRGCLWCSGPLHVGATRGGRGELPNTALIKDLYVMSFHYLIVIYITVFMH